MNNVAEKFIRYALDIGAIKLAHEGIKLKSGRISPYFFNSGLFNTGKSILELSEAYTEKIPLNTEVIFGPAYKGIPLATAIAIIASKKYKKNIGLAFNRKEKKDHGEGGIIVGYPLAGKSVCIVDDVITTGSSSGEAVEIIRANGGNPIACIIAFDRQECGSNTKLSAVQEFEYKYNIPVYSVATLADLIKYLRSNKSNITNGEEAYKRIIRYKNEYGADLY